MNRAGRDAVSGYRAKLSLPFRLPPTHRVRVVFVTDYLFEGGKLLLGDNCLLSARSRASLVEGVCSTYAEGTLHARLGTRDGETRLTITLDGVEAIDERDVEVRATRAVWVHALLALGGSFAGFVASLLYLHKAALQNSAWALKMGQHTAGWHLLLTLTLLPGALWGGRIGIRIVQGVCLVFFGIHIAIALANVGANDPGNPNDSTIAIINALSGALFLAASLWGTRAHRDMEPGLALSRAAEEDGTHGLR